MEVGVFLPEDVAKGLVSGAFADDVLSGLENGVSDFVGAWAPGGFRGNEALVVLAGVAVPGDRLGDPAKEFARGGSEYRVGGD